MTGWACVAVLAAILTAPWTAPRAAAIIRRRVAARRKRAEWLAWREFVMAHPLGDDGCRGKPCEREDGWICDAHKKAAQ